jgi:uncharacterized protein (TIGR02996 family)
MNGTQHRHESPMPFEDAALLRAVLADPDGDAPRLAYAAALESSADPADCDRAEFIRTQVELANLAPADPKWPALALRERSLLARHRRAWEKPLRNLLRPPVSSFGRWLGSQLFGTGGTWAFRRGFVENILAPAPKFLAEDVLLLAHAPIRRVVLAHASEHVPTLAADSRLDALKSLHLVADMESDEDLSLMIVGGREAGLTVFEFRFPRLWEDAEDLFDVLRTPASADRPREPELFPAWAFAGPDGRRRLTSLAASPRIDLLKEEPGHEGELLALNEWVYLGDALDEAWAIGKGHQDLEDGDGRCRRLVFLRPGRGESLKLSPYFHAEVG